MSFERSDSDSKKSAQQSGAGFSLVMLILNVIIIQNTSRAGFEQVMKYGDEYYSYHLYMMWASISTIIMYVILMFLGCSSLANEKCIYCAAAWSGLILVGLFTIIVLQFVKMGELWDKDPQHTMPWYNPFWTESITHFPSGNSIVPTNSTVNSNLRGGNVVSDEPLKEWAYDMSDVVVRIYGFLLMICVVILGSIVGCGGCICGVSKCCSSREQSQLPTTTLNLAPGVESYVREHGSK